MMECLPVQYQEYRPELAELSPEEVSALLVDAASRLPLIHVLVGWDLSPALLAICQWEYFRKSAEAWQFNRSDQTSISDFQ
jgi:hypothetical protein